MSNWKKGNMRYDILDEEGKTVCTMNKKLKEESDENLDLIISSVNALAGVKDIDKFIKNAKSKPKKVKNENLHDAVDKINYAILHEAVGFLEGIMPNYSGVDYEIIEDVTTIISELVSNAVLDGAFKVPEPLDE